MPTSTSLILITLEKMENVMFGRPELMFTVKIRPHISEVDEIFGIPLIALAAFEIIRSYPEMRCSASRESFSCTSLVHILLVSPSFTWDFQHMFYASCHLSLATLAAINLQLLLMDFQGRHNCTTVVRTDPLEVAMEVCFIK